MRLHSGIASSFSWFYFQLHAAVFATTWQHEGTTPSASHMKLIPEQSLWWELAEYLPWARNAESLPPWSLRVCKHIWRFLACQQSGSLMSTMDQWVFNTRKHETLPWHIFAWYELHDKVSQLSPSCMLACILCALSFLCPHRCAFRHGCMKNGFVLQSLWWVLCWIFLLITQRGIFTTMIVEGLQNLANESGDVLVVLWMQCSGNGRKDLCLGRC